MKAIASTKVTDDSKKHLSGHASGLPEAILASGSSQSPSLLLQRKAACPCGGGCPACQVGGGGIRVSVSGEPAELEADQIADKVINMSPGEIRPVGGGRTSGPDRRRESSGESESQEEAPATLQMKERFASASPLPPGGGGPSIPNLLNSEGHPLDQEARGFFEPRLGVNLGQVRVHTDATAAQSARGINARAYTFGEDIVFDSGEYQPDSATGKYLLAHELAHVIQQRNSGNYLFARQEGDVAAASAVSGMPAQGQMFVGQTPGGVWYYMFNPADYVGWIQSLERFVILHINNAFQGVTEAAIRAFLAEEHHFSLSRDDPTTTGYPPDRPVRLSIALDFHRQIAGWMASHYPDVREREVRTGLQELPPEPVGLDSIAREGAHPEPAASADPAAATTDRHIYPARTDLTVMEGNARLSLLYLLMMQHFTSLPLNDANRALASDGLTPEELEALIDDDSLRRILTALFTQGWVDFVNAGGSSPDTFGSLIERILEQYTRGNPTATANRLRIGHGIPEGEILGIVHRNNGILLYDDLGQPLRWSFAPRDHGYIGFAVSESALRESMASSEPPMTHREEIDMLTLNLFLQATGTHDIAMVEQAALITFQHIETVSGRIREGLPGDITVALAETIGVLTGFMVGHAFTAFAMRNPSPYIFGLGVAVEILLRGAGYVMGIRFLSDVEEVLLEAGFHMSRVRDDEQGNPTALSEYHMNMAAEPIRQLIIDTAVFMGGAAFAGAARSATVRGAVLRWGRVAGMGLMLGVADAVPAARGAGGGPGRVGGAGPMVEAPALVESPLIPESEIFVDPARAAESPRLTTATPPVETAAAPVAPLVAEIAPPVEAAPAPAAPVAETARPIDVAAAPAAPVAEMVPPVETAAAPAAPVTGTAPLVEAVAPTTTSTPPAPDVASPAAPGMPNALVDAYLADPTGTIRRARLARLREIIETWRSDREALREHLSTEAGRAAIRAMRDEIARLERETAAMPVEEVVPEEPGSETAAEAGAESGSASPESAPPESPAAEAAPEAARTPRVLDPSERVSVNPDGSIYYPEGTRYHGHTAAGWTEMTVAEAEARGARRTAMPERIPSGVYSFERPALGDQRVVLRAWLGFREVRAGLERHMRSAGEYAIEVLRGWQRAHASGAGLGAESGEAIRLAPEFVNQILQNRGIERFLRDLRDRILPEGGRIHVTTVVETHPTTLRLAAIEYRVEVLGESGLTSLGDVRIEVTPEGNAQGFARSAGGDTYASTPIFDTSGRPVR